MNPPSAVPPFSIRTDSDGLIFRLRSIADDEREDDEWLSAVCRESADEIARLRAALEQIVRGDYGEGAERAHPAVGLARQTLKGNK